MKVRKRISRPVPESEVQLCEQFIEVLSRAGFVIYPEVGDWDIVALGLDNEQLGIQAKMRPNINVLYQAIRRPYNGPRYRSVLVPKATKEFIHVAKNLGLYVFTAKFMNFVTMPRYTNLVKLGGFKRWESTPLWLPPVPSSEKAGVSSPRQLTRWRIQAIRLCLRLFENGRISSKDFDEFGISKHVWVSNRWIKPYGKEGRYKTYVQADGGSRLPIVGFETIAEQIKEIDKRKERERE
jgi:hypothetical protein